MCAKQTIVFLISFHSQLELNHRFLTNSDHVSHCNRTGCHRIGENVETIQSEHPLPLPLSEPSFRYQTKNKTRKPPTEKPNISSLQEQGNKSKYLLQTQFLNISRLDHLENDKNDHRSNHILEHFGHHKNMTFLMQESGNVIFSFFGQLYYKI